LNVFGGSTILEEDSPKAEKVSTKTPRKNNKYNKTNDEY